MSGFDLGFSSKPSSKSNSSLAGLAGSFLKVMAGFEVGLFSVVVVPPMLGSWSKVLTQGKIWFFRTSRRLSRWAWGGWFRQLRFGRSRFYGVFLSWVEVLAQWHHTKSPRSSKRSSFLAGLTSAFSLGFTVAGFTGLFSFFLGPSSKGSARISSRSLSSAFEVVGFGFSGWGLAILGWTGFLSAGFGASFFWFPPPNWIKWLLRNHHQEHHQTSLRFWCPSSCLLAWEVPFWSLWPYRNPYDALFTKSSSKSSFLDTTAGFVANAGFVLSGLLFPPRN